MRKLFVYGTLLKGEPNHYLLRKATFLGEARTEATFELRNLGDFPGMVIGGITAVIGEVYEVDTPTITALDRFEGHPRFFRRTTIVLADGSTAEAYLLTRMQVKAQAVIRTGYWREPHK